ncbi:hypothetical protein [Streptomyces sp. NBC_00847]|uniref:hypothetical protein n=1 Tax=Streptomyces sp. NBC_00847 TaxID=2975850 RepID=UPI00225ABB55|nr:hypothetical protein [Streptomyces sp. NBC_00847]MCX4878613.1 hypothetical protein [Streptomyces sp. NBC_00847]
MSGPLTDDERAAVDDGQAAVEARLARLTVIGPGNGEPIAAAPNRTTCTWPRANTPASPPGTKNSVPARSTPTFVKAAYSACLNVQVSMRRDSAGL